MSEVSNPASLMPPLDKEYPFLYPTVGLHLGVYQFHPDRREQNLYRAKKLFDTYNGIGIALLCKGSGEPLTSHDITADMIAQHDGQVTGYAIMGDAEFEEHLLNVVANHTGVRRLSHRTIRFHRLRLDHPRVVVQEINDQYVSESRRVEIYPDGRMLWSDEGGTQGTAEEEFTDVCDVPGLTVINDRSGQSATQTTAEEFDRLWALANRTECMWITKADPSPAEQDTRCPLLPYAGAFCLEHHETARRMFPVLFPE
ncbi:hypothetical protein AB0M10_15130 [Streptomyces sp. NPDC051840]|uniref:DUF6881 domain-containing protein n=1 Tax=Streptomyces sp. NPDC051840 TaxID=3154752 RepID=UPI003423077F